MYGVEQVGAGLSDEVGPGEEHDDDVALPQDERDGSDKGYPHDEQKDENGSDILPRPRETRGGRSAWTHQEVQRRRRGRRLAGGRST